VGAPTFDPAKFKATTREQWQEAAEAWDRWGPTLEDWLGPATEAMLDGAGVRAGGRVLDVAAGAGGQTRHLLGDGLLVALVARSFESLAVERVEVDAVGLVSDEQVEDGPDEGEAAALAGEATHHLRPTFDLTERSLEQIR